MPYCKLSYSEGKTHTKVTLANSDILKHWLCKIYFSQIWFIPFLNKFWLNSSSNLSPTWAAFQQRATAWSSLSPPLLFQTHWRVNECVVSIERHADRDNGNGAPATTKDYFA